MADTSQPTVFDYASPTTWRIRFARIPKVEWFCTNVNIPGITLGEASYPTPMTDIGITGDKLTFETLTMTFLVDEELQNYRQIWDWLVGIGFPKNHNQFASALSSSTSPLPPTPLKTDKGTTPAEKPLYDEATLIIYNSKNIAKVEVKFKDIFPTSLSGLNYAQDATDVDYFRADATFRFLYYEFETST
tara:strand:+ start:729 stop:1295 length:567 start_codon:yes stop_codon:yes gene_type:complete